jgi:hypothetical protein
VQGASCLLPARHPAYRWLLSLSKYSMTCIQGNLRERGNSTWDVKGTSESGNTVRTIVPMLMLGADCFVVVKKLL